MPRRKPPDPRDEAVKPNLTPLIDVVFQLITFFIMLMTIAKDDAAQRIHLPIAQTAAILDDDQIPDSINVNIAWLERDGRRTPVLLGWGLELNLDDPAGFERLRRLIATQADIEKRRQIAAGTYDPREGLSTTVIVRVDEEVDYGIFRQVMRICRENGFTKFQLKAADEEEERGGKAA